MAAPDAAILERIAAYNEDDVRATLALRDWLVGLRPAGLPWRAARLDPEDEHPELDARVAALHAYGPDTPEHLLGDLLGYWVREYRAYKAPKLAQTSPRHRGASRRSRRDRGARVRRDWSPGTAPRGRSSSRPGPGSAGPSRRSPTDFGRG